MIISFTKFAKDVLEILRFKELQEKEGGGIVQIPAQVGLLKSKKKIVT